MERGGLVVSVGCGMAGNAESGTEEIRKDGLSHSILTASTHVRRSRVKYLSLRLKNIYGPLYGPLEGNGDSLGA